MEEIGEERMVGGMEQIEKVEMPEVVFNFELVEKVDGRAAKGEGKTKQPKVTMFDGKKLVLNLAAARLVKAKEGGSLEVLYDSTKHVIGLIFSEGQEKAFPYKLGDKSLFCKIGFSLLPSASRGIERALPEEKRAGKWQGELVEILNSGGIFVIEVDKMEARAKRKKSLNPEERQERLIEKAKKKAAWLAKRKKRDEKKEEVAKLEEGKVKQTPASALKQARKRK